MKKLLFLTALLTSLFLSFTACSDNMMDDDMEESGGAVLDFGYIYNLNAKLGYDEINDRYLLLLNENKKRSIIDTLIIRNILIGPDKSYESGTFYSGTFYIDYKRSDQDVYSKLEELIGLDISTVLSTRFILDGDDVYENGWAVRLSNISVKTTSRSGQFYPYEPKVFPEAYRDYRRGQ